MKGRDFEQRFEMSNELPLDPFRLTPIPPFGAALPRQQIRLSPLSPPICTPNCDSTRFFPLDS